MQTSTVFRDSLQHNANRSAAGAFSAERATMPPARALPPLALIIPVIALLLGWLILHEPLNAWHWAGATIVMLALVVQIFGGRRKSPNL